MEKHGFKDINIEFINVMSYTPDNASISTEMAIESINVNRLFDLNSIEKALKLDPNAFSKSEYIHVINLINSRYDERIKSYQNNNKVWDMYTSTIMIVTGKK